MNHLQPFIYLCSQGLMLCSLMLLISPLNFAQTTTDNQAKDISNAFSGVARTINTIYSGELEVQMKQACVGQAPERTYDGSCNNVSSPGKEFWGATHREMFREIPAQYGMPNTNDDIGGQARRNPREISNMVSLQPAGMPLNQYNLSAFVFAWGQFIDHDIALAEESLTEAAFIPNVAGDVITAPIPFMRNEPMAGTGGTTGVDRQQMNTLTAWVDASMVYGPDINRANWLRTFTDGKMKTSAGNFLPYNTNNLEATGTPMLIPDARMFGDEDNTLGVQTVFVAGDVRANEQPTLLSLHTLFVREHNRICDDLLVQGWTNDELIYQEARRQVGAIIQAITFNEFLPALGVNLATYTGYDNNVRPDIMNVFATAAYRIGHTMVVDELPLLDDACNPVGEGLVNLRDAFFQPQIVASNDIDAVLKGLSTIRQEEIDAYIVEDLRTFLLLPPIGPGFDLVALNLQRARDHGLPDYNTIRNHFLGTTATTFADISTDPLMQAALQSAAFNNINDVDPWVAMVSEDHVPGAALGATLQAVLKEQFERLRDGDFYYYHNNPEFDATERASFDNTYLSNIIIRNTSLSDLPANVFQAASCSNVCGADCGTF